MAKFDIYQQITDDILELMEKHGSNWKKSWVGNSLHNNPVTGTTYSGINVLLLGIAAYKLGYASNEWSTFKGWKTKDGTVRVGEKGTHIVFFKQYKIKNTADDGTVEEKIIPMLRGYTVFNRDQISGLPEQKVDEVEAPTGGELIPRVETYIDNLNAKITYGGSQPCYIPARDEVHQTKIEHFRDDKDGAAVEHYYSTLFHELTHWTKKKDRCDRDVSKSVFGNETYAFEELVAEIGGAFQCAKQGISAQPRADHAKYLNNWIEALKDNKKLIFKASTLAQKAVTFMDEQQPKKAKAKKAA